MWDAVSDVLRDDPDVLYALAFGSRAKPQGRPRPDSDLDIAIGVAPGLRLSASRMGALISRLEQASEHRVDLLVVAEASIPVRFAVFRDGRTLFMRDRAEFVRQKARAIVGYLDFRPTHELLVEGALKAAARG